MNSFTVINLDFIYLLGTKNIFELNKKYFTFQLMLQYHDNIKSNETYYTVD